MKNVETSKFFSIQSIYTFPCNPRSKCPDHGIHLVSTPWGSGTGFTLLFEALILQLAMSMSVKKIVELVGEK